MICRSCGIGLTEKLAVAHRSVKKTHDLASLIKFNRCPVMTKALHGILVNSIGC